VESSGRSTFGFQILKFASAPIKFDPDVARCTPYMITSP